jgi:hypothetical protein
MHGKAMTWPATCVAPAANGVLRVVRRSGGLAPPGTAHLPRRHGGVHADAAQRPVVTPAPRRAHPTRIQHVRRRSGVAAHDVALGVCSGVREQKQFVESVFKIDFLHVLKLKCTLHKIAKLKIIYSSTTSAKAVRVFDH